MYQGTTRLVFVMAGPILKYFFRYIIKYPEDMEPISNLLD